jgi:hypothetical protein
VTTSSSAASQGPQQVPLTAIAAHQRARLAVVDQPHRQFPATTISFNLAKGAFAGRCGQGDPGRGQGARHARRA